MTTQEIRGLVYDFLTGCGGNTPAQIAAYIGDDALIDEMLDNITLTPENIEHVRAVWNEVLDEVKIEGHNPPTTHTAILTNLRRLSGGPAVVDVTCHGCDYTRPLGAGGWSAVICAGCGATLTRPSLTVGDRICAGWNDETYDEGTVTAIDGDQVNVSWDGPHWRTRTSGDLLTRIDG